jgi:anaerobic selenocysteine-containing dehydrogenase
MASARTTLFEYLMLSLNTICGRWLRAGEQMWNPGTAVATRQHKAQATPPYPAYGFGQQTVVPGLANTLAGPPTSALPDQILTDGPDKVRALFCLGGNPVVAFPDQLKTVRALDELDLFVVVDPFLTASSRMADYVIAPRLHLESPGLPFIVDLVLSMGPGCGYPAPWSQYTPAIVDPPAGSDVVGDWELFYEVARRMGKQLHVQQLGGSPQDVATIDMEHKPTEDELIEQLMCDPRIPLDEIKRHPHGAIFSEPAVFVEPKDPGWEGKLDVGNVQMLADLAEEAARGTGDISTWADERFPFRLISRRVMSRYNSSGHAITRLEALDDHNPLFVHPDDLAQLGIESGTVVEITSGAGTILGMTEADDSMRRGVVSMVHCFGDVPERDGDNPRPSGPTGRLMTIDDVYEPYIGMPLMGNVPVSLRVHQPA